LLLIIAFQGNCFIFIAFKLNVGDVVLVVAEFPSLQHAGKGDLGGRRPRTANTLLGFLALRVFDFFFFAGCLIDNLDHEDRKKQ